MQCSFIQTSPIWADSECSLSRGGGVPGRTLYPRQLDDRPRYESEEDKLARRIREGTIKAPEAVQLRPTGPDYAVEAKRLSLAIDQARARAEAANKAIARIEAVERKRQKDAARDRLRHELLLAQQALQLAQVQEAVYLEELEVLDVAFIASAVLTLQ